MSFTAMGEPWKSWKKKKPKGFWKPYYSQE